jgi:hypothetical protein
VDIIGNPSDALATTANFIAGSGWMPALRWGIEVAGPKDMLRTMSASEREHGCLTSSDEGDKCKTIAQWAVLGVKAVNAQAVTTDSPEGARAALLAPSGEDGPAWLVTGNFQAIWQYNRADAYALAIGLLSDALRGDPPMRAAWPTDDIGLSRDETRDLQQVLVQRGHTDVVPDGFDGPITREAIRSEEKKRGWPETGRAGTKIVKALQDEPAVKDAP